MRSPISLDRSSRAFAEPSSPPGRLLPRLGPLTVFVVFFAAGTAIADCTLTTTGNVPLLDLGPGLYQTFTGGLYPGGSNARPASHEAAGLNLGSNQILPRNSSGAVDLANGKIVMISVGMSNTTDEFGGPNAFKPRADGDHAKNPKLVIVDGAQSGQDASRWTDPNAVTWSNVDSRLASAGVTPQQVQVAWVKQALANPSTLGAFPAHAQTLQNDIQTIARNLLIRYPNIKIAYFSSRTRAYTNVASSLNPEPYAYESGLSVKWMIENQINGTGNLNFDPSQGTVVAPYLSWGPYLWADGTNPRSDGFTWLCSDTQSDFTHPSATGVAKVGDELLAFFKTDPTARPWFLRHTVAGLPPTLSASASIPSGGGPVQFTASASDLDGTIAGYAWTFEDGTFSFSQNPTKSFPAPGTYHARVTTQDNSGNSVTREIPIAVAAETIVAVSPGSGSAAGGIPVAITGASFASGASVTVGGQSATGVGVANAGLVNANTPALSPGTLNDVSVANPSATAAVLPKAFFADFTDVAQGLPFHDSVESIVRASITAGCTPGLFCPNDAVTRAQMAVFLLRGEHGPAYVPPPATGTVFADVPANAFAAAWIEQLHAEGITGGCSSSPLQFCSSSPVTRAQMAVFLLRAEHGSSYAPPPATGTVFADVPANAFAAAWIEELYAEAITGGCSTNPLQYCPDSSVTRGQMAVFLTTTFNLQ